MAEESKNNLSKDLIKNLILIDETYNANPYSVKNAINKLLSSIKK